MWEVSHVCMHSCAPVYSQMARPPEHAPTGLLCLLAGVGRRLSALMALLTRTTALQWLRSNCARSGCCWRSSRLALTAVAAIGMAVVAL